MSEPKWYIGIDPGKTGGIFGQSENGEIKKWKTPLIGGAVMDIRECKRILSEFPPENSVFALEDVHSIFGVSAKANFSFGQNVGQWEGILEGGGLTYFKIAPKEWQKFAWEGVPVIKKPLKKGQKNASKDTKAMSKVAVQRIYPTVSFLATLRSSVPHEGIVDAGLISHAVKCKWGK